MLPHLPTATYGYLSSERQLTGASSTRQAPSLTRLCHRPKTSRRRHAERRTLVHVRPWHRAQLEQRRRHAPGGEPLSPRSRSLCSQTTEVSSGQDCDALQAQEALRARHFRDGLRRLDSYLPPEELPSIPTTSIKSVTNASLRCNASSTTSVTKLDDSDDGSPMLGVGENFMAELQADNFQIDEFQGNGFHAGIPQAYSFQAGRPQADTIRPDNYQGNGFLAYNFQAEKPQADNRRPDKFQGNFFLSGMPLIYNLQTEELQASSFHAEKPQAGVSSINEKSKKDLEEEKRALLERCTGIPMFHDIFGDWRREVEAEINRKLALQDPPPSRRPPRPFIGYPLDSSRDFL